MPQLIPPLPQGTGLVAEHISVFNTGTRFGHHIGDSITPFLIMRRFFMPGWIIASAIDLNQYKTRSVILLLDDLETGNPWFLHAAASVFERGGQKDFNLVRLNMDKNMDYKHNILPADGGFQRSPSPYQGRGSS